MFFCPLFFTLLIHFFNDSTQLVYPAKNLTNAIPITGQAKDSDFYVCFYILTSMFVHLQLYC